MDINSLKETAGFKGEILTDDITLTKYSRDASIFEIRPEAVVYPKNADDVKALVKWVLENKKKNPELSITGRSAGTDIPEQDNDAAQQGKAQGRPDILEAGSGIAKG